MVLGLHGEPLQELVTISVLRGELGFQRQHALQEPVTVPVLRGELGFQRQHALQELNVQIIHDAFVRPAQTVSKGHRMEEDLARRVERIERKLDYVIRLLLSKH